MELLKGAVMLFVVVAAQFLALIIAWDPQPDGYEVIDGPAKGDQVAEWQQNWRIWRQMELQTIHYDAKAACNVYNLPHTQWTQSNLLQAVLMLHDRAILDRNTNEFQVDRYLDAMERQVGILDSVLLWSSYPNLGIDNLNQFDMLRRLPGGLSGVAKMIRRFHERNVKVIIAYNPWDTATRDEPGLEDTVRMYKADIQTLNEVVKELGADAFNGDTMYGVPKTFFNCSSDQPLVASPEGGVPSAYLSHNPLSWGYFGGFAHFPPVARAKFLEPRHMVQICSRWSLNKIVDVQEAFFNGAGYVLWENVWGIWNANTERENEAIRRAFTVLRKFSLAIRSSEWKPYAFSSFEDQIHFSEFPFDRQNGSSLFTGISASSTDTTLRFPVDGEKNLRYFDVYNGHELKVEANAVYMSIEAFGFAAVLKVAGSPEDIVDDLSHFLAEMRRMTEKPLRSFSMTRPFLKQTMESAHSTSSSLSVKDGSSTEHDDEEGLMVHIRGCDDWQFNVSGVMVEPVLEWTPNGYKDFGVGVQFPWEDRPHNDHSVSLHIRDFDMDKYPVTNEQFCRFLRASGYSPIDKSNFLVQWTNRHDANVANWQVPKGFETRPVVHVAYEDAAAFASFYNKRLPHDWEWQFVASNGVHYSKFPWGNALDASVSLPTVNRDKNPPPADPVGSHPSAGSTSFGVHDLVGYIWQMTDKFCDEHTCGLLLRGGSFYQPVASTLGDPNWYFPQVQASNQHNRFLMYSQSYDRSAYVGFRCVRDVL